MNTPTTSILAVLAASLLGSPHCAAMCGGFTTFAVGVTPGLSRAKATLYHLGRLFTYMIAGFGAANLATFFSPMVIGAILIGTGLLSLCKFPVIPSGAHRALTKAYRKIVSSFSRGTLIFPLIVGFASTLLPCGWLYLYVGIAAASESPLLVMLAFWAGTLPILLLWSESSRWILDLTGRAFPIMKALLLVFAGVIAMFQHVEASTTTSSGGSASCHSSVH